MWIELGRTKVLRTTLKKTVNGYCRGFLCSTRNPRVIPKWLMRWQVIKTAFQWLVWIDDLHCWTVFFIYLNVLFIIPIHSFSYWQFNKIITAYKNLDTITHCVTVNWHIAFFVTSSNFVSPVIPHCPSTQQNDTSTSHSWNLCIEHRMSAAKTIYPG